MLKTVSKIVCIAMISLLTSNNYAQVGIGTTTPNAALEINSSTTGLLLPRVALTATNVEAPVVNPQGGDILAGTMVYNTNTAGGTFGVIPGMYFWDGDNWVAQFHRKFTQTNTQLTVNTYSTGAGFSSINDLSGLSFIAPYDGVYQFVFSGYLGANAVEDTTDKIGFVEGFFRMTIDGTDYDKYDYSASLWVQSSFTNHFRLTNEINLVVNIPLNAGDTCNYSATYNPNFSDNTALFVDEHLVGKSGTGYGNACEINITYIGRD